MLDEQEYKEIHRLFQAGLQSAKDFRVKTGAGLKGIPFTECYAPMLAHYKELTGYSETNPNAVMHHRLSLYGPPCSKCGKPLRTPKAKICGGCMAPRSS